MQPETSRRRPRRWQVAQLTRVDVVRLTWLMWAVAMVRGLDYGTGHDDVWPAAVASPLGHVPPTVLVGIEAAFPLWVWSIMFLAAGTTQLIGMVRHWHAWVWAGHVAFSVLYLGLAIGLFAGYAERPWFDGVRNSTGLLVAMALHALLWWRMGPAPVTARPTPSVPSTGAVDG